MAIVKRPEHPTFLDHLKGRVSSSFPPFLFFCCINPSGDFFNVSFAVSAFSDLYFIIVSVSCLELCYMCK